MQAYTYKINKGFEKVNSVRTFLYVYVYLYVLMYYGMCVDIMEQLVEVGFLLLPCES